MCLRVCAFVCVCVRSCVCVVVCLCACVCVVLCLRVCAVVRSRAYVFVHLCGEALMQLGVCVFVW